MQAIGQSLPGWPAVASYQSNECRFVWSYCSHHFVIFLSSQAPRLRAIRPSLCQELEATSCARHVEVSRNTRVPALYYKWLYTLWFSWDCGTSCCQEGCLIGFKGDSCTMHERKGGRIVSSLGRSLVEGFICRRPALPCQLRAAEKQAAFQQDGS